MKCLQRILICHERNMAVQETFFFLFKNIIGVPKHMIQKYSIKCLQRISMRGTQNIFCLLCHVPAHGRAILFVLPCSDSARNPKYLFNERNMAVQKTFFLVIHLKLIYSPYNSNFLSTENFEDNYIIDIFIKILLKFLLN